MNSCNLDSELSAVIEASIRAKNRKKNNHLMLIFRKTAFQKINSILIFFKLKKAGKPRAPSMSALQIQTASFENSKKNWKKSKNERL